MARATSGAAATVRFDLTDRWLLELDTARASARWIKVRPSSPVRRAFSRQLLKRSVSALRAYWVLRRRRS